MNIGVHIPRKPRDNAEERLQRALVQLLMFSTKAGVWWCAIPNGEARSKVTGARLKAQGVIAGAPDMVFCVAGQFKALELKAPKGRQSSPQLRAEHNITAAGGDYRVAGDIDSAMEILREWGVLPEYSARNFALRTWAP